MAFDLLILSDIRFSREGLAEVLGRDGTFQIVVAAAVVEEACAFLASTPTGVVLIDTALPNGIAAVETLCQCASEAKIVAFALMETETEVIAWARAGIAGYIPRNTPLSALVGLLISIVHGEQVCSSRVASDMLRWIAQSARTTAQAQPVAVQPGLTSREQEIARLMSASLSNKEIARRLGISLATTKSHVHNILAKLGVRKRGQASQCLQDTHNTPSISMRCDTK
jgi:two-component system nitrate/nitrite response regulator NarL